MILINNKTDSLESALVLTSPELLLVVVQVVEFFGGGDRTRTRYLLLAKQPLSQLSYTPKIVDKRRIASLLARCVLMYAASLSPRTACFSPILQSARVLDGGSSWARTNDPRLIKTVL